MRKLFILLLIIINSAFAQVINIDEGSGAAVASFTKGQSVSVTALSGLYTIEVGDLDLANNRVTVALKPELGTRVLSLNEESLVDVNKDGDFDIAITLTNINPNVGIGKDDVKGTAILAFRLIQDTSPTVEATTSTIKVTTTSLEGALTEEEAITEDGSSSTKIILIVIVILVILAVAGAIFVFEPHKIIMKKVAEGRLNQSVKKARYQCPKCNKEVIEGDKFCIHCGFKLDLKPKKKFCPSCGREIKDASKFCTQCGFKL